MLWDRGYWEPEGNRSPEEALKKGDFKFILHGNRLRGSFVLVQMRNDRNGGKRTNWLLIKHHDEHSMEGSGAAILDENMASVASGRTMDQIAGGKGRKPKPFMMDSGEVEADAVWDSKQGLAADDRKRASRKTMTTSTAVDLPDFIAPQLCETRERPPAGRNWLHEIKFDGYRIQMRVVDGEITLKTRKGLDWTAKYPEIAKAASDLPDCIIDGEICALDDNGAPDFAALQAALSEGTTGNLVYFAFDLLFDGCEDLRPKPLTNRKAWLQQLLADATDNPPFALSSISRRAAMRSCVPPASFPLRVSSRSKRIRPTNPAARPPGRNRSAAPGMKWLSAAMPRRTASSDPLLVGVNRGEHFVYVGRVGMGY